MMSSKMKKPTTGSLSESTPMLQSSHSCSLLNSSSSFASTASSGNNNNNENDEDDCRNCRLSRVSLGGKYNREHLQHLIGVQVAQAMGRFYRVHARALAKLEQLLMEELVPRLGHARPGHAQLLDRMMRRLNKLRPAVLHVRAGLHRRLSSRHKSSVPERANVQQLQLSRSSSRSTCLDADLRSSSLCCQLRNDTNTSSSILGSKELTLGSESQSQSQSQSQPVKDKAKVQARKKIVQLIYQNHAFSSAPFSELSELHLTDADCRISAGKCESGSGSGSGSRSVSLVNSHSMNRKQLETNLLYKKSSFSLYMNRFKYPPPWPHTYTRWCRPRSVRSVFMPQPWEEEEEDDNNNNN